MDIRTAPAHTGPKFRCFSRIATASAAALAGVVLCACASSRTADLGSTHLPLPPYKNSISTAFPGGTCTAVIGKPFTTFVVLTGGYPPYKVTWYVNGRPSGLDHVQVTRTGADTDPIYANGTKYTITFTPRSSADKVAFEAVDYRNGVLMEKTQMAVIGGIGPCLIEP